MELQQILHFKDISESVNALHKQQIVYYMLKMYHSYTSKLKEMFFNNIFQIITLLREDII